MGAAAAILRSLPGGPSSGSYPTSSSLLYGFRVGGLGFGGRV